MMFFYKVPPCLQRIILDVNDIGMNYRVERLVRIICNEILPYFQFSRQQNTLYQQEPAYIRASREVGFKIWLAGKVEPVGISPHHYVVTSMTRAGQTYTVDVRGPELRTSRPCNCAYAIAYNGSRLCKHYFAAQAHCLYGPAKELVFGSKLRLNELIGVECDMEMVNESVQAPSEEHFDIGVLERLVLQVPLPVQRIMELTNHVINSGDIKLGTTAERLSSVISEAIQRCNDAADVKRLAKLNAKLIADKHEAVVMAIPRVHQDKMCIIMQKHLVPMSPKKVLRKFISH